MTVVEDELRSCRIVVDVRTGFKDKGGHGFEVDGHLGAEELPVSAVKFGDCQSVHGDSNRNWSAPEGWDN